jgi:hypothetical protein
MLATWAVFHHRPSFRRVLALAILLCGILLAIVGPDYTPSVGTGLLLLTPLCWQLSHLVALGRLQSVSPQVLAGARYIYGGAMLMALWLLTGGVAAAPRRAALTGLLPLLAVQGCVLSCCGSGCGTRPSGGSTQPRHRDRRPFDPAALHRCQLRALGSAELAAGARLGARRQRRVSHVTAPRAIAPPHESFLRRGDGRSSPSRISPLMPRIAIAVDFDPGHGHFDLSCYRRFDGEALMTAEFFHRDIQQFIRHRID